LNTNASSSALPTNLRSGLVGYWPFNGNANDESGNGNHGTVNGPVLSADRFGVINSAYLFSVNTSSNTNNITIQNLHQNNIYNYSVAGWFKIDSSMFGDGGGTIFAGNTPLSSPSGLRFALGGTRIPAECGYVHNNQWGVEDGWNTNGILGKSIGIKYNNNLWHSFAVTFSSNAGLLDSSAFKIYIDGVIIPSESYQKHWPPGSGFSMGFNVYSPINNGVLPVVLGNHNGFDNGFRGNLDDICIYHRVLSATEIQQFHSQTVSSILWSTGATTPSITVLPTSTTSYIATVSNGIQSCKDTVKISIQANPTAPATIQKQFVPTSILAVTNVSGLVSETYRIKKVANAVSYDWSLKRGTLASITHLNALGANDTAVTVTFNSCFLRDTLCVKSVGVCSSSVAKTIILYRNTIPANIAGITTPGGNFAACIGTTKTFTAYAATPTATQTTIGKFRWSLPATVSLVSANTDSSTITVQINTGFVGGTISVRGVNSCTGTLGTALSTSLQHYPPTPLGISSGNGSFNACINNSITYTAMVPAPTASQAMATVFRWTKPANTTILSASFDSSSITVRFNTGFTGGALSVRGQTICGTQGTARSVVLSSSGCKASFAAVPTNTDNAQVRNASIQGLDAQLYPNPSAGSFNLKISTSKTSPIIVKVMSTSGVLMKSFIAKANVVSSIGEELKAGVYMVEVIVGDERKVIRAVKM
jgi:hypothetical protein